MSAPLAARCSTGKGSSRRIDSRIALAAVPRHYPSTGRTPCRGYRNGGRERSVVAKDSPYSDFIGIKDSD